MSKRQRSLCHSNVGALSLHERDGELLLRTGTCGAESLPWQRRERRQHRDTTGRAGLEKGNHRAWRSSLCLSAPAQSRFSSASFPSLLPSLIKIDFEQAAFPSEKAVVFVCFIWKFSKGLKSWGWGKAGGTSSSQHRDPAAKLTFPPRLYLFIHVNKRPTHVTHVGFAGRAGDDEPVPTGNIYSSNKSRKQ